ncbi:hypothetical protein [Nocardia puris]|uniref:Uncharacterized protein n=1 Tax=Nocardia puris TaxID=208602 RepID=A0A366DE75_9NOCA|nr:hypothetical protein [Nocardia puris]RBO87558.1 hypothetical protein DFR74_111265 [Nocardia puris]
MSAADQHRAAAENYLRRGYEEDADFAELLVSMANASALLAIEARLGELVDQQRIGNALAGTGRMGVFNSDSEILPARRAVRRLLGLDPAEPKEE